MKMIHKSLFLLGSFLFSVIGSHAQYEYQPFVKEGKRWCVYAAHDYQYLMQGDTVIGGEVMKKVHLIDEYHFHDNSLHYIGAVKEEGKKVYITYDGKDTPMLLYDFDMKSSSLISYDDNYVFQIDNVYLYQVNSTLRYEQTGHRHYPDGATEIIRHTITGYEGVGYVFGLDPFLYTLNPNVRYLSTMVRACYEDEACIIFEGDFSRIAIAERDGFASDNNIGLFHCVIVPFKFVKEPVGCVVGWLPISVYQSVKLITP